MAKAKTKELGNQAGKKGYWRGWIQGAFRCWASFIVLLAAWCWLLAAGGRIGLDEKTEWMEWVSGQRAGLLGYLAGWLASCCWLKWVLACLLVWLSSFSFGSAER